MGCGPIDPGSNPGGGLFGELLRLSSTQSDWTLVDFTWLSLAPHHVSAKLVISTQSDNSRRCRLRGGGEAIGRDEMGCLLKIFSASSLCLGVPSLAFSAR